MGKEVGSLALLCCTIEAHLTLEGREQWIIGKCSARVFGSRMRRFVCSFGKEWRFIGDGGGGDCRE